MSQSAENNPVHPGFSTSIKCADDCQTPDAGNVNAPNSPGSTNPAYQLLTRNDLTAGAWPFPWAPVAYGEFLRHVSAPNYPCTFAVAGERTGTLRYSFVENKTDGILKRAVLDVVALSRQHPEQRHALAVFIRPEQSLQSHDYYRKYFWDVLQTLHDDDTHPWPGDVPVSPANPKWEFCFGGEPMFVFGASPSHFLRRSRNLGPSLVLLFQPRSVFRGIEGGTKNGSRVRELIRQRLGTWDLIGLHSSMGNYGDPSNFEAAQYFVPDDDQPSPPCPLQIRGASAPQSGDPTANPENFPAKATVNDGLPLPLESAIRHFLPASGSLEVQRDPAGRVHSVHTHPVNETLYVVDGELLFHVHDEDFRATAGTTIHLPAGTLHSSAAGPNGCLYLIVIR